MDLIRPLEAKGRLTKRTREQIELEIGNFSVIERGGKVIGCVALNVIEGTESGKLACLIIHDNFRSGNRRKVNGNRQKKRLKIRLKKLFILTTQSIDWFLERGLIRDSVESPLEIRQSHYGND